MSLVQSAARQTFNTKDRGSTPGSAQFIFPNYDSSSRFCHLLSLSLSLSPLSSPPLFFSLFYLPVSLVCGVWCVVMCDDVWWCVVCGVWWWCGGSRPQAKSGGPGAAAPEVLNMSAASPPGMMELRVALFCVVMFLCVVLCCSLLLCSLKTYQNLIHFNIFVLISLQIE